MEDYIHDDCFFSIGLWYFSSYLDWRRYVVSLVCLYVCPQFWTNHPDVFWGFFLWVSSPDSVLGSSGKKRVLKNKKNKNNTTVSLTKPFTSYKFIMSRFNSKIRKFPWTEFSVILTEVYFSQFDIFYYVTRSIHGYLRKDTFNRGGKKIQYWKRRY